MVWAHVIMMLMIAKFCAIGVILLESMSRDGSNDFDSRCLAWYSEIEASNIAAFVIVGSIKLTTCKPELCIKCTLSASPILEQELDCHIAFVCSLVTESTFLIIFQHEKVRADVS